MNEITTFPLHTPEKIGGAEGVEGVGASQQDSKVWPGEGQKRKKNEMIKMKNNALYRLLSESWEERSLQGESKSGFRSDLLLQVESRRRYLHKPTLGMRLPSSYC